jgi:hypothetical protein
MNDITSGEKMREHMQQYFARANKEISDMVVNDFISGLKFNSGHIAHMHYGSLLGAISESELIDFLSSIGISQKIFIGIRDASCEGDMDARGCVHNPGYTCDPRYCHSH